MSYIGNDINQRIMNGKFPGVSIFPAPFEDVKKLDIKEKAEEGLEVIKYNDFSMAILFEKIRSNVNESETYGGNEYICISNQYISDANFLINTEFDRDDLNPNEHLYYAAASLPPVATSLDKVLWNFTCASPSYGQFHVSAEDGLKNPLYYAWIYCLLRVEKKELATGKTVDINKIEMSSPYYDLFLGEWDGHEEYLMDLSGRDQRNLHILEKRREDFATWIDEDLFIGNLVAKKTEKEWDLFCKIINDLSQKESQVIETIVADSGPSDKVSVIENYRSILSDMGSGIYYLGDEAIDIVEIRDAVWLRMSHAGPYNRVAVENGASFFVTPLIILPFNDPKSNYNYLFISYHRLRLLRNQDSANEFLRLSLLGLQRNLLRETNSDQEEVELWELDRLIEEIYSMVISFVEEHKPELEKQAYKNIQDDSVVQSNENYRYTLLASG